MEKIIPTKEYMTSRNNDKRVYVLLPDGRRMARARLVMMNYLHTSSLPTKIHIHHINGNSLDDSFENLQLYRNSSHVSYHVNPLQIPYKERRRKNLQKYNNSPKTKSRVSKWKMENKEYMANYFREYYSNNKEKLESYKREWRRKKRLN